jgi:CHAT domain-containing protein
MVNFQLSFLVYWGRLRKLYDLAFKAALEKKKSCLATEIADSLKSRPTIRMYAAAMSLSEKDRQEILNIDALFLTGGFRPGVEKFKELLGRIQEVKTREINDVPDNWAAVHFHFSDGQNAYAVVVSRGGCHDVAIDISGVLDAYLEFEKARRSLSFEDVSEAKKLTHLVEGLCEKAGEMLDPVWEFVKSRKIKGLIFIPHGFLHLVPIHAAKLKSGSYLFQEKRCLFLPAWSLAPIKDPTLSTQGDDILLKNWKDNDQIFQQLLDRDDWSNRTRGYTKDNNARELFNWLKDHSD